MAQKRIMIKKGTTVAEGGPSEAPAPTHTPATRSTPGNRKPRRRAAGVSHAPLIVIAVLLIVVVTGAIVTARHKTMERRRAILYVEGLRKAAARAHEETASTCKKTIALGEGLDAFDSKVVNAVKIVLGEDLDDRGHPLAEAIAVPPDKGSPAAAVTTDADTHSGEGRDEAVVGILTREQLDARRAAERARHEARKATGADTATPATASSTPRRSPIKQAATDARHQIDALEGYARQAATLRATSADELARLKQELRTDLAARKRTEIDTLGEASQELLSQATQARTELEQLVAKVERLRKSFELADQQRREQQEQERKKHEHAQLVAREQSAVAQTKTEVRELWRDFAYEAALDKATDQLAVTTAYEAKPAAELLKDKAEALANMKAFLIEQINESPMQWGWRQSGGSRHITGADSNQITFTGGSLPWSEVGVPQMVLIIKHYLAGPQTLPSLQVEHAAALGLYFTEAGQPSEAMKYVERGCGLRPASATAIRRLVPMP